MADETFATVLNEWRKSKGFSGKEAAAALDVDYPTYRKYASGKRTPCKYAEAELRRRIEEKKA